MILSLGHGVKFVELVRVGIEVEVEVAVCESRIFLGSVVKD